MEIDTSQSYSHLGFNYRRSHPNYQYNPCQPQRHSVAPPLHRSHQSNSSLQQSPATPSPTTQGEATRVPVSRIQTYGDLRNVLMKRVFLFAVHLCINTRYKEEVLMGFQLKEA